MAILTTLNPEDLIPLDHPIRWVRRVVDEVLAALDDEFEAMYSRFGRPSVPPEQLLKATVLMALYSMRSERAFCERLNYDLLFKWFLDLPIDAPAFDPTTFTKNRERLLGHEIADRFFAAVVRQAKLRRYVSSEHFSVDGTCSRPGPRTRASSPKTARSPPAHRAGATARSTSGAAAEPPNAPLNDRSRGAFGPQVQRGTGHALLRGAHPHGEPIGADRGHGAHPGRRVGRTGGGRPDAA